MYLEKTSLKEKGEKSKTELYPKCSQQGCTNRSLPVPEKLQELEEQGRKASSVTCQQCPTEEGTTEEDKDHRNLT